MTRRAPPARTTVQLGLRVPPAVRAAYVALASETGLEHAALLGALLEVAAELADESRDRRALADRLREAGRA